MDQTTYSKQWLYYLELYLPRMRRQKSKVPGNVHLQTRFYH